MVKIGNKEVIFSTSFVMDRHESPTATFMVPGEHTQEYDIEIRNKPAEVTELTVDQWTDFNIVNGRKVISFDVLPGGRTEFHTIGAAQFTQNFDVQIVRQAIWNNFSMLVHVIVLREKK